jgi:UDPglucose 6-dehydrogenase
MIKKVAMIGVGKLGEPCATVMSKHYDVVGYDVATRHASFPMKSSIKEAVQDRDFIFIAAPTPHDSIYGGETPTSHLTPKDFDYSITADILKEVNKHVNERQLVILISTVLPGTVRTRLRKYITNARFVYNPYLIAMGSVAWDFVNPEMVIIGTQDGSVTGDAKELIDFYRPMMQNNPRYEVGTWDEAESIKIFYNTFISTKLALVNMIQDVAESNGNINVDVVTQALAKSTNRITSPAYMTAGLGDAGACHPRDNIALRYLAARLDLGYDLFDAIMQAREVQSKRIAEKCIQYGKKVTIVGKAYKPAVPYTNGSCSLLVGHYLTELGAEVNYYDIHTGDLDLKPEWTDVYLIGYWEKYIEKINFPVHATIVDPWRKFVDQDHAGTVIHYGNTRPRPDTSESSFLVSGNEIVTEKLTSGIVLTYPRKLDGGGLDFKDDLLKVIRNVGKYSYRRGFEWCAGFGALGFEMLGMGVCNHIVFSDTYKPAIDNCLAVAKNNNIQNYVTGYVSETIHDLPEHEIWDLVISNPPHCENLDEFLQSIPDHTDQQALANTVRLCVDPGFEIHKEFFTNIKKHINANTDIFLIEENLNQKLVHLAKLSDFRLEGAHKMNCTLMANGHILHFKLNDSQ